MSGTTPQDELVRSLQSLEAEWTRASRNLTAVMPKEMAGAFNLMTHPASMISASAIVGLSVASQAAGLWMGAWMGAAENVQRIMAAPLVGEQASRQAAKRARAAADTLIAEANSLAAEIAAPAARRVATSPAAKARKAEGNESVVAKSEPAMPSAMAKPATPDDLKQISGVGPKLEQVLNKLGIWTYGQIAALTPAEIDWIEEYLSFKGRIGRDDWLGQAVRLAGRGG